MKPVPPVADVIPLARAIGSVYQTLQLLSTLYNSMSPAERTSFDRADNLGAGVKQIIADQPADFSTNPYKYAEQKYSVYLGGKQDPKYLNFKSMVGNLTAPIINEIYGAAVTGSELARAQNFIPDLATDSTEMAMNKLQHLAGFYEYANAAKLARKAGVPMTETMDDYIAKYDKNYKSTGNSDKAALDEGYTQEEIDSFKKKQGFSSVGNTSASIEIPQTSRLSYVNNNPGNLRFAGQEGAEHGQGGFAKFSTPQAGVLALENQIKLDQGRGHTLSSFISKFAPPSENDTDKYISQAMAYLGADKSTPIKNIPLDKLTKFMALKESSTKIS